MSHAIFLSVVMKSNKLLDEVINLALKYFEEDKNLTEQYRFGRKNVIVCKDCWEIIKRADACEVNVIKDTGLSTNLTKAYQENEKLHNLFFEIINKFGKNLIAIGVWREDQLEDDLPQALFVTNPALFLSPKIRHLSIEKETKIKAPPGLKRKLILFLKSKDVTLIDKPYGIGYWIDAFTKILSISELKKYLQSSE